MVPTPHPGGVAGGAVAPVFVVLLGVVLLGVVVLALLLVDGVVAVLVVVVVLVGEVAVCVLVPADPVDGVITPEVPPGQLAAAPVGVVAVLGPMPGVVVAVDGLGVVPGRVAPVVVFCPGVPIVLLVPTVLVWPAVVPVVGEVTVADGAVVVGPAMPGVAVVAPGVAVLVAGPAVLAPAVPAAPPAAPAPPAACARASPVPSNNAVAIVTRLRLMKSLLPAQSPARTEFCGGCCG